MSLRAFTPLPVDRPAMPHPQDPDQQRLWFAVALPAVIAVLLVLVPLLGTAAGGAWMLVLVPLVAWTAFHDTERALYVYCAWCWTDGTIRGLFQGNQALTVARDVVMLVILVGWLMQRILRRSGDPLPRPPGRVLVSLFILNCLIQMANPYGLGLMSSLAGLKMHLSPLPLYLLGYDVFRRRGQVYSFFVFLTLLTAVAGLVSIVQYQQGPVWTYAHFPGSKEVISQNFATSQESQGASQSSGFKPPGTTTFGGGTGVYIGFVVPLAMTLLLLRLGRQRALGRGLLIGIIFVFVVGLFLNGVRSALVEAISGAVLTGVLVGGWLRVRALTALLVCFVLGLGAWTLSQNLSGGSALERFASTFSDPVGALHQDRVTFFDQFGDIIFRAPLGVGMGRVGAAAGQFATEIDNLRYSFGSEAYLGCMVEETGIVGALLIFCVAVLFLLLGFAILQRLRESNDRFMAAAMLSVLAIIFANFFLTPVLLGPPGSVLFWLFGAILMRVYGMGQPSTPGEIRE